MARTRAHLATLLLAVALSHCFLVQGPGARSANRYEFTRPLMGTTMRIVMYAPDAGAAQRAAAAAFGRIAELDAELSDYRDSSELMRLSRQAGSGPVRVSDDLFRVLRAAQQLFRRSDGAFDVTVGPLTVLWRRARRQAEMPDLSQVAAARQLVGGYKLILDEQHRTVTLLERGMRLDVGGIAKGFAADEAATILERRGITRALVAAGGDLRITGPPPESDGWRIAIQPLGGVDQVHASSVMLHNAGVSTSGDAEQFVVIDGVRYSHIIDPCTGRPKTGRSSVTVVAPDATMSDGLATAVAVLGPEKGLRLVDATPQTAATIAVETDARGVETLVSLRWPRQPSGG